MKADSQKTLLLGAICALVPTLAHAYIGPGLGAGAIAAAVGMIGAILLALFAVIYYPIKRMRKKRRADTDAKDTTPASSE